MTEPTTPDPVAPYLHCECGTRLISGERCPLCGWGWNDTLSAEPDPVAARLGYLRACMEAAIEAPEAFDLVTLLGDWGKAMAALDELWTLAGGWIGNAPDVPLIDRETAGLAVQAVIRAALIGKDGTDGH